MRLISLMACSFLEMTVCTDDGRQLLDLLWLCSPSDIMHAVVSSAKSLFKVFSACGKQRCEVSKSLVILPCVLLVLGNCPVIVSEGNDRDRDRSPNR